MASVLPALMSMCYDPVPNVRLNLAVLFECCMAGEQPLGDVLTAVRCTLVVNGCTEFCVVTRTGSQRPDAIARGC